MKYIIILAVVLGIALAITLATGTNGCEAASFGQVTC